MNIIFTRSNHVNPDPRVEKEIFALCKKGHKVSILAWDRDGRREGKSYKKIGEYLVSIKKCYVKSKYGSGINNIFPLIIFQFFLLFNLISKRKSYDVIHAADFDTVLPALLMKFLFKKKVIYDIYDFYVDAFSVPEILKGVLKNIDFYVIGKVDAVILVNESRVDQIKGAKPKKIYFIHNSPEDNFKKLLKNKERNEQLVVAYVGVLQKHRLLEEILEVFVENNNYRFLVAGFGPLEKDFIKASENHDNIEYFGRVSYAEGLKISASADILFATYDPRIPNHKYSSPNKLYEAMMLEKPIIVCKNTGVDALIEENEIGYVIDYSKGDFINAVNFFSKINDYDYNVMCDNSRELYEKKFSWNLMEERLLNIYSEISEN